MDQIPKLRPLAPEDEDLSFRVYASTREDELALLDWDDRQKETFLKMQFTAQHQYYTETFPRARFQVIHLGREPIGRLYVDYGRDAIRLIDIALLPQYRNMGIGSFILRGVLIEGERSNLPVRIHVGPNNPARRLYERHGFRVTGCHGVYLLMEWSPGATGTGNDR